MQTFFEWGSGYVRKSPLIVTMSQYQIVKRLPTHIYIQCSLFLHLTINIMMLQNLRIKHEDHRDHNYLNQSCTF